MIHAPGGPIRHGPQPAHGRGLTFLDVEADINLARCIFSFENASLSEDFQRACARLRMMDAFRPSFMGSILNMLTARFGDPRQSPFAPSHPLWARPGRRPCGRTLVVANLHILCERLPRMYEPAEIPNATSEPLLLQSGSFKKRTERIGHGGRALSVLAGAPAKGHGRAMSYPFTQQEIMADETLAEPGASHLERLTNVATRLHGLSEPVTETLYLALRYQGGRARAMGYQRERPSEYVVPTEGPSWKQAACIVATSLIGAGVLGLPYAMRQAGWAGLVLILATTFITAVTAKMLVWCFTELNERKLRDDRGGFVATYDQLAEEVAGRWGGGAMRALTVLECYGCAICYVVLHSTNWPVVFSLPPTL